MNAIRIGVDFDNTIVCYDELFHRLALERGLIGPDIPPVKTRVRDALRRAGREADWTALQGIVYGERLLEAAPFPGVLDFFHGCKQKNISVCIISHKTKHPVIGPPIDLHAAARNWLREWGFFNTGETGLDADNAYFELTKQEKLSRIETTACTHFIDDLPELLRETEFPQNVQRILFDPRRIHPDAAEYIRVISWDRAAGLISIAQNFS